MLHTEVRTSHEEVIQWVARMIRRDPTWHYTIDQLVAYSKGEHRSFSAGFKAVMGTTPSNYIIVQRIKRAKRLLRTTSLPLAVIAVESGFGQHSPFAQSFKRHVGIAPHVYRLRIREGVRIDKNTEGPVEPCGGIVRHS